MSKKPSEIRAQYTSNITASDAPPAITPQWIMYLPGGWHTPQAKVDGKAASPKVYVDEETAEDLQRDLQRMRAEPGANPFFDFDHDAEERAAEPLEFAWMDYNQGRRPGVYARVRWTNKGALAVTATRDEAPQYSHFSPRCAYDAETKRVTGLMPRSAGLSAGGLVNDPAFETISALTGQKAAAQAAPTKTKEEPMKKELLAALAAAGLLTEAEADTTNAHELLARRITALKKGDGSAVSELTAKHADATAELARVTAELTAAREQLADAFVKELEASRKVAPLATEVKDKLKAQYLKDPAATELLCSLMPAAPNVTGDAVTTEQDAGHTGAAELRAKREAHANALVAGGTPFPEAWESALAALPK